MDCNEAMALGLRAVACKGWREMPGMLLRHRADDAFRLRLGDERADGSMLADVGPPSRTGWAVGDDGEPTGAPLTRADPWPDFRDPATLGCLLALVRDAWGSWLSARESQALIGPPIYAAHSHRYYATEAEALVAALEAA